MTPSKITTTIFIFNARLKKLQKSQSPHDARWRQHVDQTDHAPTGPSPGYCPDN
jgi:hypothetical protein